MRKIGIALVTIFFTSPIFAAGNMYVSGGAGAVFPSSTSSYTSDSSSVLYSPTVPGSSLFTLPAVNWKNKYNNGFDLSAALGYQFTNHLRADIEFLYQNTQRKISGSYNWLEQDASNGSVYARNSGNPISRKSVTANVFSLLSNFYYDFNTNSKWVPSVGAGFGIAWMSSDSTTSMNILNIDDPNTPIKESAPIKQVSPSLNGTALALQTKLGIAYAINESTSVALIYRLFATSQFRSSPSRLISNPGTAGESTFHVGQHNVSGLLTNSLELNVKVAI